MKLKNLTALIFRFIGLFYTLDGMAMAFASVANAGARIETAEYIGEIVLGCCVIYFSKMLARVFCRGLDNDLV